MEGDTKHTQSPLKIVSWLPLVYRSIFLYSIKHWLIFCKNALKWTMIKLLIYIKRNGLAYIHTYIHTYKNTYIRTLWYIGKETDMMGWDNNEQSNTKRKKYNVRLVFENTYFWLILFSINLYCFYFSEIDNDRLYANKWNEKACCDWDIKGWSWGFWNFSFSQSCKIIYPQNM